MLKITKPIIHYTDPDSLNERSHHILVAELRGAKILISHANLYLSDVSSSSLETSNRYSDVISQFYKFIATQEKFKKYEIHQYHVVADNRDIRRWQVDRQIKRQSQQKLRPSSETIYKDAKLLLLFFSWLRTNGYTTNVKIKYKTWVANFKSERLLNYISHKAKTVINASNIQVLDKKRRQKKLKSLINNKEIQILLNSFCDPVYSIMFKVALDTAMRPMDICNFPYIGVGKNAHILPFSDMNSQLNKQKYFIESSKGNKDRAIDISTNILKVIEDDYINSLLQIRRNKYKKLYGKACPPSILFLNKLGVPITSKMISDRTYAAVTKAKKAGKTIREGIDFYQARHWWPTMYILNTYKEEVLTSRADVLHAAAGQVLINQLGHNDISTTFKYYVDRARVIALAYHGRVSEIINENESILDFIKRIDKVNIDS